MINGMITEHVHILANHLFKRWRAVMYVTYNLYRLNESNAIIFLIIVFPELELD